MSKTLQTRLMNSQKMDKVSGAMSSIKGISELLSDAADLAKNSDSLKAIAGAAPGISHIAKALGEVIPPVKFAAKLFEQFTKKTDPELLGHLACTLAYQSAIHGTVNAMEVPIVSNKEVRDLRKRLAKLEPSAEVDFKSFSFERALTHEFVQAADRVLRAYAKAVGYKDRQRLALESGVHTRFVTELKILLSDGESQDLFKPFTTLLGLQPDKCIAYATLAEHAQYQRWLFESAPVLKGVPYSLGNVYVDRECGNLRWNEITRKRLNLSAEIGARDPVVKTVMNLIADPDFSEAIVIQGAAGSGKSAITLKLCCELLDESLRPIRIRMLDLDLRPDKSVFQSLIGAIQLGDDDYAQHRPRYASGDLFLKGSILEESVLFHEAPICPYILLFDGWDEISLSADEGFKERIRKLLSDIREEFLQRRRVPIRLILTGRPSKDVDESKFFRDETRVLTIRPFEPNDAENLIKKHSKNAKEDVNEILEIYKNDKASMAVFGLPLLANLAIRLLFEWKGDRGELTSNPTTLYRLLVDMTIEKSGRAYDATRTIEQPQLTGSTLRDLLWQTGTAITNLGEENIPFAELKARIRLDDSLVDAGWSVEEVLSALTISFYFKCSQTEEDGKTERCLEFENKSFREYLFAEAIVETLKEYGRTVKSALAQKEPFWKEFSEDDPRFQLACALSEKLAPQWLRPEVVAHLEQLLTWEIGRIGEDESSETMGTPTRMLDLEGWKRVRSGIADVWDWWAEGVHLRPQPHKEKDLYELKNPPYVQKSIELCNRQDEHRRRAVQSPNRTVTMDAHLGDGLIRLCSLIHYLLAVKEGWLEGDRWAAELWDGVSPIGIGKGPRKCQSSVTQGDRSWVFFAPTQEDPHFFGNYMHRINAAGWRPSGPFPLGVNLSGIDLRAAIISIPYFDDPTDATIWTYANLSNVKAAGSCLHMHEFHEVLAKNVDLRASYLVGTDFLRANLEFADFSSSTCAYTIFEEAKLRDALLRRTDLENVSFVNADLEKSDFIGAVLDQSTSFEGANVGDAKQSLGKLLKQREASQS